MAERGESTLVGYLPKVLARSAGRTLHLVVAGTSALSPMLQGYVDHPRAS